MWEKGEEEKKVPKRLPLLPFGGGGRKKPERKEEGRREQRSFLYARFFGLLMLIAALRPKKRLLFREGEKRGW